MPPFCVGQHTPVESVSRLLEAAIDYAGLFPPAALTTARAVDEYDALRAGPFSWMLGCLVAPVATLEELSGALDRRQPRESNERTWRVSAVAGEAIEADLAAISRFNLRQIAGTGGRPAVIDSIEIKVKGPNAVTEAARRVPRSVQAFFEVPLSGAMPECLAAIREAQGFAKLRAGGVKPDQFPSIDVLAGFILAAVKLQLPFKATAGLHHATRGVSPLAGGSVVMHGFLNLLIAVALARAGMDAQNVAAALEERESIAFRFDAEGVWWRGQRLTNQQLAESRRHSIRSWGSCSFAEPVEDLRALRLL
jgi:hypothetical protein